jgi:hypothetical protein
MADSKKESVVDWSRFGLDDEDRKTDQRSNTTTKDDGTNGNTVGNPNIKELFDEDQVSHTDFISYLK